MKEELESSIGKDFLEIMRNKRFLKLIYDPSESSELEGPEAKFGYIQKNPHNLEFATGSDLVSYL